MTSRGAEKMISSTIGVDISKDALDIHRLSDGVSRRFGNDKAGHRALIAWIGGDGSRLAAASMAVLYSGILRSIERRGYDVFGGEIKLSAAQRARGVVDAWRLARGGKVRGWEKR